VLVAALPVGGAPTPFIRWGWLIAPAAVLAWLAATAPAAVAFLRARSGDARVASAALFIPALLWLTGRLLDVRASWAAWVAPAAVIAVCVALARGGVVSRRGVAFSFIASAGLTLFWVLAMRWAYARYGFDLPLAEAVSRPAPMAAALLAGVATEVWLRGALFGSAVRLGGWPTAVVASTAVGIALQYGRPQEIVFWHLFSGIAFAAIRLRSGDAVGLAPARAFGDTVLQTLAGIR
jgi:hypothetical protein